MIDPTFGHWLAGFTDGEGSFTIDRDTTRMDKRNGRIYKTCRFRVCLRADDLAILQKIQRELGMGNICVVWRAGLRRPNPVAEYGIGGIADAREIVKLFTTYPLRAKKAQQFAAWADAVAEMSKGADRSESVVAECEERLQILKSYIPIESNDDHRALNPVSLHRHRDHGTPPFCLCGCGETTTSTWGRNKRPHPENPQFHSYCHGHHLRTPEFLVARSTQTKGWHVT